MIRIDGRAPDATREVRMTADFTMHAEGSVLIEVGRTRVICTASVEDRVPPFLRGSGKGWVTAEYGMLPRATSTRTQREASAEGATFSEAEFHDMLALAKKGVAELVAAQKAALG